MSRFRNAIRFVQDLPKEGILSIVLFGSVASGNDTKNSDIDIAIIYQYKDEEVITRINELREENIELLHLSLEELQTELEIQFALAGEGVLLYGNPLQVIVNDEELIPKMLLVYDTTDLDRNIRNKLHRALYGGRTTSRYRNKLYKSEFEGIVSQIQARKLGKGVLFCDKRNAPAIIRVFKNLRVPWKEIAVWESG